MNFVVPVHGNQIEKAASGIDRQVSEITYKDMFICTWSCQVT